MFDLHHRFLDDFTHVVLNPLQLGRGALAALPAVPLAPEGLTARADLMPALLPLGELPHTDRLALIDHAIRWQADFGGSYFGACLVSRADTAQLARHLARVMIVAASPSRRFLLRHADPRVFTQLCGIFDDVQLDVLMGPVSQWHWQDPTGAVRRRDRGQSPQTALVVRAAQLPALQRVGLVNTCLATMLREGCVIADAIAVGRELDAALDIASRTFGLSDGEDRCLYAVQLAMTGLPPEADARWKIALDRVAAGELSYVGACAALHDAENNDEPAREPLAQDGIREQAL